MQTAASSVAQKDFAAGSPARHNYNLPATPPGSEDGRLPRLDRLPVEVLSLVASLISPPFYLEPPPEEPTGVPQANVIESLDPAPQPEQTFAQALSSTTKTCSHVLEAARPWLWEDVNVRSGRGWLAVVDALTEEVVDNIDVDEADHNMSAAASTASGPQSQPLSPILASAFDPSSHAGPSNAGIRNGHASVHFSTDVVAGPSSMTVALPVSVPVGTGVGRQIVGRTVTINTEVAKDYFNAEHQPPAESSRSPSSNCTSPPPPPHRVGQLLTPPGSRATSPNAAKVHYARLRGRSRSPRRSVTFEPEGISSVLQRSLSMSLPAGKRPFMRQSSLSHSRVVRECDSEDEEDTHNNNPDFDPYEAESLRAAMRTPPKEDEEPQYPVTAVEEPVPNVNPDLLPPPGPYIRHLSFTNFRTIGSRRSQDEAVRGRFVTAGRLEGVIKNTPNLRSLCMTEYVDSALSYPVLEEIFFRGYSKPRIFHRTDSRSPMARRATRSSSFSQEEPVELEPAQTTMDDQIDPPRPEYVPYEDETEDDKWERRSVFTPLEAVDLTGCVSGVFTDAINEFGDKWLNLGNEDDNERGRTRDRRFVTESTGSDDEHLPLAERRTHRPLFTALRRLSLRACTRLHSQFLTHLILAMPNLTHLDLSGTRVTDSLLIALTQRPPSGMQLESLSLARCPRLDPSCVVDFLIECPAAHSLVELNLFVNPTQGNAIQGYDLARLLREAPCFKSGRLRYLDLSSAAFTPAHLAPDVFSPQPSLVSFGLSYVPHLPLRDIATFLQSSAPGVEILTLTGSAVQDLRPDASTLQITLTLHTLLINPLTTLPFSISGLDLSGSSRKVDLSAGPTRLRVVELSSAIRRSLDASQGSGRSCWQVVRSKGGRGWYVDVSAGWIPHDTIEEWGYTQGEPESVGEGLGKLSFVRRLPATHPRRRWLTALAEANGRVRSAVGWHSRKMEVVRGEGMMGREEGMGGVGAFAFEE